MSQAPPKLDGEWWAIPGGGVLYADGDLGADSHTSLVQDRAFREVVEALEEQSDYWFLKLSAKLQVARERHGLDISLLNHIIREMCDEGIRQGRLPVEASPAPLDYLTDECGVPAVSLCLLTSPSADERLLAMRHWDWIRIREHYVTLWALTKRSLRYVADGLYEAYDEAATGSEFYLEEAQSDRTYWPVPWAAIEGGDLAWIRRERQWQ